MSGETAWCWCHARWGLYQLATGKDDLCDRWRNSSPSACERRHFAESQRVMT